jgi:DNA-binding transcriptional LysR family regulator
MPHLNEVRRRYERLECRLLRGTASEVVGLLKSGDAELGIASDLGEGWDRLDRWPLFTEDFILLVNAQHRLGRLASIELSELREERLLLRAYCEHAEPTAALLRSHGLDVDHSFQIASESDLMSMLASDLGVAIVPRSTSSPETLARVTIDGLKLVRPVHLYGVAGRQRTTVAALVMKMLRAADWSRHIN